MSREKYNLIQELRTRSEKLKGKKKLSLIGQQDFSGGNNVMRGAMNEKHHTQHLCIDNPEFPFIFEGKENVEGEYSSFYTKTDKVYQIIKIVKKYDGLLKGKTYSALYFLYSKEDDSYTVVERKEVENLTENFGFQYNNEYLDLSKEGDIIPSGTLLSSSTSYDENGNVSVGVNGRILYAVHPAVQDDAIIVSDSFAKRMVCNNVTSVTIPINDNTILLNLYGKDGEYQGLPNIGDVIENGIIAATRTIKESRMFSDMRDSSLRNFNKQTDQVFYGKGEIIDINVYSNNPNMKKNRVNKQIYQYHTDAKWFYSEVYKTCKSIIKSGSKNIDRDINRWMRKAMNYLDTQSQWVFNDNIFQNVMVEILIRQKESIKIGRKIVGRAGNKTVVCSIWPDDEMPYLTTETRKDEYGVDQPVGVRERVDVITNPLAIINRTIPMVLYEGSVSFILDRVRKHMNTMDNIDDQKNFMFSILRILNARYAKDLEDLYDSLSDRKKREFIEDAISIDEEGHLITSKGIYVRWEAFSEEINWRDAIIEIYDKYGDIIKPYNIFVPKKKWGRDIYIGQDCVGYQYIMMLKQSGEKGFSVRASGSISDESLPEKSHDNKIGKSWKSEKPIRFGKSFAELKAC